MNLIKVVRVKQGDIIGIKHVWDIFLNCKNEEVIKKLSKIILCLHFHFHETVDFTTKKARALVLMTRLDKHIKDGFKKGNLKLMKHSLILLKDIIDYVKEKPITESILQNYQQYFKTSIKILFENQKH
jgi:ABC-type methionine transport system ATPase subunit